MPHVLASLGCSALPLVAVLVGVVDAVQCHFPNAIWPSLVDQLHQRSHVLLQPLGPPNEVHGPLAAVAHKAGVLRVRVPPELKPADALAALGVEEAVRNHVPWVAAELLKLHGTMRLPEVGGLDVLLAPDAVQEVVGADSPSERIAHEAEHGVLS